MEGSKVQSPGLWRRLSSLVNWLWKKEAGGYYCLFYFRDVL